MEGYALLLACVVAWGGLATPTIAVAADKPVASAGILGVKPGMSFDRVRQVLRSEGCRLKITGTYKNAKKQNIGVWKLNAQCSGGRLRVHFNSPELGSNVQNIFFTMKNTPKGVSTSGLLDRAVSKYGHPEWCRNNFGEKLCFWGTESKFLYARARSKSFGLVYVDKESEKYFNTMIKGDGRKAKRLAQRLF